jgi:hypothetical protein
VFVSSTAIAADRKVKCQIDSHGEPSYKGTCLFLPDTNGSFSLENSTKDKPLTGAIRMVSVTIIEKGVAEVRGLTADGINSRWGEAKRSSKDKACWKAPFIFQFTVFWNDFFEK